MAISATRTIDETGVIYMVETRDGIELRRFRLPLDQQPQRIRLEAVLDESADDMMRLQYRIDHIADYGLGPAAQAVLLNALNARKAAALARDLALLTAWRNA